MIIILRIVPGIRYHKFSIDQSINDLGAHEILQTKQIDNMIPTRPDNTNINFINVDSGSMPVFFIRTDHGPN